MGYTVNLSRCRMGCRYVPMARNTAADRCRRFWRTSEQHLRLNGDVAERAAGAAGNRRDVVVVCIAVRIGRALRLRERAAACGDGPVDQFIHARVSVRAKQAHLDLADPALYERRD